MTIILAHTPEKNSRSKSMWVPASRTHICTCLDGYDLCEHLHHPALPTCTALHLHAAATFGFQIIKTLVTDIEPAAKVKAAMNEINAAQRLRQAAYEQSEADKIRIVKAAEADAEAK